MAVYEVDGAGANVYDSITIAPSLQHHHRSFPRLPYRVQRGRFPFDGRGAGARAAELALEEYRERFLLDALDNACVYP